LQHILGYDYLTLGNLNYIDLQR